MQILQKVFGSPNDSLQTLALNTVENTVLASVCGYGGAFIFTHLNPTTSAIYFGSVAVVGQVSYHIFDALKEKTESPLLKNTIVAIQFLQIPVLFYLLPGNAAGVLSGVARLELITATAYFVATPLFFYLARETRKDPNVANISATVGVMLTLANGMKGYATHFA